MAELIPLTITARLQQGAALDARFGIGLDGLLTSLLRAAAKNETGVRTGSELDGGASAPVLAEIDLPLARCAADPWHWMCTTAYPLDWDRSPLAPEPDVHHIRYSHQREIAEQTSVRLPQHVPISAGRYRSRRVPVVVFPAPYIQFRAVGDPTAIQGLLDGCHSIGSHRRSGEGAVLGWDLDAAPGADEDLWGHAHGDGTLGRPVPAECAERLDLTAESGRAGIRPPYWHPDRQHTLLLPTYPKERRHAA